MAQKTLLETIDLANEPKSILFDSHEDELLCCSEGHIYNPKNISHVWWKGLRQEGGNCPEVMSYDRMSGSRRCQRKLFNITKRVDKLYEDHFRKRYSGNDSVFTTHCMKELPNNTKAIKELIRSILMENKNVKTGYTATSVRGYHTGYILYQKQQ
jgi:hypothetical protein